MKPNENLIHYLLCITSNGDMSVMVGDMGECTNTSHWQLIERRVLTHETTCLSI